MDAATFVALSSQMALRQQMDVVADNIANAATPAFQSEHIVFSQYFGPRTGTAAPLDFVHEFGMARDNRPGPLSETGNPLDLAIEGDGYFEVSTPFGTRYTRNGHFSLDAQGQLVTADGYPVLDDGSQPLIVPSNGGRVTVTREGTLSTSQGEIGRLAVVRFDNDRDLVPSAGGLFVTEAQPTPATAATVRQGMIEGSNVQPIVEMTRLMTIARNYASAQNLIDSENDRLKDAIDKLGKTA